MKILHLISQYPSKTGSGIYLTEVYKNFKSMNFTQKVLCAMNEDDIIKVNFDDYEIIKFKSKDLSFPVVGMSDVMPYESFLFSNLVNEKLEEYIRPISEEDFERFIGEQSKSLAEQIEEHRQVFERLRDK